MQKILEIKKSDWLKGISAHNNLPLGGLFQTQSGIDPFEMNGSIGLPSLTPANVTLATTPKIITNNNAGGVRTLLVQSDTKLYSILADSPYTITDLTSGITAAAIQGGIIWKNRYIYATVNDIRSVTLAGASDSQLKSGYNDGSMDYRALCIGANGNLYYGDSPRVGVLTAVTGTSGNSGSYDIDVGFVIRDIVNDGRYLVILADNNTDANASRVVGKYTCRIYFWDMASFDSNNRLIPDAMWDFEDSYIIGAKVTDNGIEVITYNGIYVTNVATQPRMIRPFPITVNSKMGRPLNPSQIIYYKGSLSWIDGSNTFATIYSYGNPITGQQKIFYNPYVSPSVTNLFTCLAVSGNNFLVGNSSPSLLVFNTGATRGQAVFTTLDTDMEQPFTYGYIKVVLSQPLASGQSVQCTAYSQSHNTLLSNETKTYNSANPKQTLIFKRTPTTSNQPDKFEDIDVTITYNGVGVKRMAVYASPTPDDSEAI